MERKLKITTVIEDQTRDYFDHVAVTLPLSFPILE